MKMKIKDTTRQLVLSQAKRIVEILEEEVTPEESYWECRNSIVELRCKMKELRRDTMKMEREIKGW